MIIGLDLDNVTGDYTSGLRNKLAEFMEIPEKEILESFPDPEDYNFSTWNGISDDFALYHARAVTLGVYRDMEVFPEASKSLWELSDAGHHIRVVTSRFVKPGQHAMVISHTALWLDKNDIPYRDIMFVKDKTDVYADIFIDDSPENILALKDTGANVVIFDQPYNRHLTGDRVYDWVGALEYLKNFARIGALQG